jgi:hypothetical protein
LIFLIGNLSDFIVITFRVKHLSTAGKWAFFCAFDRRQTTRTTIECLPGSVRKNAISGNCGNETARDFSLSLFRQGKYGEEDAPCCGRDRR